MKTIKEEIIESAMRQKFKHELTDDQCGLTTIEELFGWYDGTQQYLNQILVDKIAELEDKIERVSKS